MYEKTNIKTKPIAIEPAVNRYKNEQYSLINSSFDPPQNSPPSLWKIRLNNRIGSSNSSSSNIEHPLKNYMLNIKQLV